MGNDQEDFMTRRTKISLILLLLGILCIMAAGGFAIYNIYSEYRAGIASGAAVTDLKKLILTEPAVAAEYVPNGDAQTGTDMEDAQMPLKLLDNKAYAAILSIPALDLELPVINELTYPNLKLSPCLYQGSIYQNDIIIGGHNYRTHFGNLKSLEIGDSVTLTDMAGNEFFYQVIETETMEKTAVDELNAGEWDLTLFTCTYGGEQRVIIRCKQDV